MTTVYLEFGIFCTALIVAIYLQIRSEREKAMDCRLFARLLIASVAVLTVDTIGWLIDGRPLWGQIWITTAIDAADLILTILVCWCWMQYALYIARGKWLTLHNWYTDPSTWLLLLQIVLVAGSQLFGIYFYIDESGVYHRGTLYGLHVVIAMAILCYSAIVCLYTRHLETDTARRRELTFVALMVVTPIAGNIFQWFVYGYPVVWLCMVFMIFTVYVHIQNKRNSAERERQNAQLKAALARAQDASRAKTDFLSHMSHDMRTPMNAILGITSLLHDRTDPTEIRADVDQIEKSGKYLLSLINDTLDMSKIESGKMELHPAPINSEDLFGNVIATAKVLSAQRGVNLVMKLPPIEHGHWVPVVADASRVEQIFMNILTNAVKFTPKGGSVTLHMDSLSITDEEVSDRYIVTDTGIGMSEDFQKHLFEPFSQEGRTNTDHESGTGLGLAIVKQIVDLMGGTISIASKTGVGTTVTVELTYPRYHGTIDAMPREAVDLAVLQGKRVLLCEDHPVNAQIAIRLLKKQGLVVDHAENGKVGVEMLERSPEHYYDVVLMDIRMPVMDGVAATKAMRALPRKDVKTVPIIAMTANAYDVDIQSSIDAGMVAHLAKPVEPQQLYETIAKYLKHTK